MTSRVIGLAVAAVGFIVFLVSLAADWIGLGEGEGGVVGEQQWAGITLGLSLLAIGVLVARAARSGRS